MFEKRSWVDLYVAPCHYRQADAFAEPSIANRKCRRLLDRSVALRQDFDACRMDIAATADDHVVLAASDTEIARLVDPAEIAGHKPALRVKRRLCRLLIVEIAEHQTGAPAADFADFAGRGFGVRIILAPDADLVAATGTAAGLDHALRWVVGQSILVRAGFGHAVTALRHDAVLHQLGDDRRRRRCTRDPEAAHGADTADATGSYLGEQVDRMRRHPEQKHGAGLRQPIDQALAALQIVKDQLAAANQSRDQ